MSFKQDHSQGRYNLRRLPSRMAHVDVDEQRHTKSKQQETSGDQADGSDQSKTPPPLPDRELSERYEHDSQLQSEGSPDEEQGDSDEEQGDSDEAPDQKKESEDRPKRTSKPYENNEKSEAFSRRTSFFVILVLTIAVLVLAIAVKVCLREVKNDTNSRPVTHRYGNLTDKVQELQQKYADSNLEGKFWDLIIGSSWSHLQDEKSIKQPVVLMLVGQPGSTSLKEVAMDISKMFSKAFTKDNDDIVQIDGATQALKDMGQAKLDMDTKLREQFDSGGKVALVSQFDKLPGCSVMLFHSYCDNDNAPYKDVVIVFTLHLMERVSPDATTKEIEEAAQQHLNKVWSQCPEELSEDKITAMHSRVANNIAFVPRM